MEFPKFERTRSLYPTDRPPNEAKFHQPDLTKTHGWKLMKAKADLPHGATKSDRKWALHMGLSGADSIQGDPIATLTQGALPQFACIIAFLKALYADYITELSNNDATVLAGFFNGGAANRAGPCHGTSHPWHTEVKTSGTD